MKPLLRQVLEHIAPNAGLTTEAIDLLVKGAEPVRVPAGRSLYAGHRDADAVVLVLEGAGRVECARGTAQGVILQLVPPGEFVRTTAVLAGGSVSTPVLRAVAHVDSWVAVIGTSLLATVLARLPGERLVQLMTYSCNALANRLVDHGRMALLRLGDRLLLELGTLAQDFGRPVTGGILIDVRLTHAQLASLVGGSRAAVCRALGALVSRGLLVVQGEYFVLPDGPLRLAPVRRRAEPVPPPMHVPAFAPLPLS